jgi:YD repeat-containing protein
LQGYLLGDAVFSQVPGMLPAHVGVEETGYAYSLTHAGGVTYYFNAMGDQVASVDMFGARTDWVWEPGGGHRLASVVGETGSYTQIVWTGTGVEVVGPARRDGVVSKTVFEVSGNQLVSIIDLAQQKVVFGYQDGGLLEHVNTASGAVMEVTYQPLPGVLGSVVDRVRVTDSFTGAQLLVREWDPVGEHNTSGYPLYGGETALWGSGDGEYRYRTQFSDGVTRVISEYNSMGLMIGREIVVPSGAGDVTVQQQQFVYPGTHGGGVPAPGVVPAQYQKPSHATVVFSDDRGRTRTVTEETVFDEIGRVTQQVSADGATAVTTYDDRVPDGMVLPVGLILEQTVTGGDGLVTKTVNTPTTDHKSIAVTETFSTATGSTEFVRVNRIEYEYENVLFAGVPTTETHVSTSDETATTQHSSTLRSSTRRTLTVTGGVVREEIVSPTGETSIAEADIATGLPLTQTDSGSRVTRFEYDTVNRPTRTVFPDGTTTTVTYTGADDEGPQNTVVTEYSNGYAIKNITDPLGRIIRVADNYAVDSGRKDADGWRTRQTTLFDEHGNPVETTNIAGQKTRTTFDASGAPVLVENPDGSRVETVYDPVTGSQTQNMYTTGGTCSSHGRCLQCELK